MADMNLPATFALFDRGTIASAVEVLVAVLDTMDGDLDLEDSEAGMTTIDQSGRLLPNAYVPPEHDEDREPDDDAKGDQSCVEWHTLGRRQKWGLPLTDGQEDDEDSDPREDDDPAEEDDPSGQCDEDGINTELFNQWSVGAGCTISDSGGDHANEDNPDGPMQQVDTGPGCPLSDEDHDDPADRAGHRKRIQRTRCFGRYRYYRDWRSGQVLRELAGYELLRYPIIPSRRSLLRRKRGMPRRPRA